ncbi:hypothetical protein SCHPADRAFT_946045 [Schizopora paradoxa]|uniref:MYND-type domain-containing protein n=1 Tax=Schizopora paradoxa TaxID=27342 RepID=A0A0H2RNW1_9AGAM|nr:hypothetical protein SCHPADRAFT_946045 [Schizopora paradoxa]
MALLLSIDVMPPAAPGLRMECLRWKASASIATAGNAQIVLPGRFPSTSLSIIMPLFANDDSLSAPVGHGSALLQANAAEGVRRTDAGSKPSTAIDGLLDGLLPCAVAGFAATLRRIDSQEDPGSQDALLVNDVQEALVVLAKASADVYARHPDARARMIETLPRLHEWMKLVAARLLQGSPRSARVRSLRPRFLACVNMAVVAIMALGDGGRTFFRAVDAYRWGADLWLELRGCTTDEEGMLAHVLVSCKLAFDDAFGRRQWDPHFAERLLQRGVRSTLALTPSDVVARAGRRFRRACARFPSVDDVFPSDDHTEFALDVLSTVLCADEAPVEAIARRGCIHDLMTCNASLNGPSSIRVLGLAITVLAKVCAAVQSTRVLRLALKSHLVRRLMDATWAQAELDCEAKAALSLFVTRMLPDVLLFPSAARWCGALAVSDAERAALCDDPSLGDRWRHLLRVYGAGKAYFDTAATATLRTCDNDRCAATETAPRQFKKCAGCVSAFYCSPSCQRAAWGGEHGLGLECQRAQLEIVQSGLEARDVQQLLLRAQNDIQASCASHLETGDVCREISVAYRLHDHPSWSETPVVVAHWTTPGRDGPTLPPAGVLGTASFWWNGQQREVTFLAEIVQA